MRLTLIDVLILFPPPVAGFLIVPSVLRGMGFSDSMLVLSPLLCGWFAASILLASSLYRRWHFRPLFLPRCPHCHKRPDTYRISESCWPREVLSCGSCHGSTEVWYHFRDRQNKTSNEMPYLHLCWPYFLGWDK